jgi:hypothetical protein
MDPIALSMLRTSVALFAVAALGGLTMAGLRFTGRPNPPTWMAMAHGLLAAAALTLLIYASVVLGAPLTAKVAAVLLVLAALGGAVLNLNYHWKNVPLPKGFIAGHAALAVLGFALLVLAVMV